MRKRDYALNWRKKITKESPLPLPSPSRGEEKNKKEDGKKIS